MTSFRLAKLIAWTALFYSLAKRLNSFDESGFLCSLMDITGTGLLKYASPSKRLRDTFPVTPDNKK